MSKFYWNAQIASWRIYGFWIKRKYFVGFSIALDQDINGDTPL